MSLPMEHQILQAGPQLSFTAIGCRSIQGCDNISALLTSLSVLSKIYAYSRCSHHSILLPILNKHRKWDCKYPCNNCRIKTFRSLLKVFLLLSQGILRPVVFIYLCISCVYNIRFCSRGTSMLYQAFALTKRGL